MAKLSIIVLQYNHSDRTLACLESLRVFDADVIVVDNASEVEHLKNVEFWISSRKLKNFKLLTSKENLGYSGGNNIGIKYALEHGAEKILLLNNDVVLHELPKGEADIVGAEEGIVLGIPYVSGAVMIIKKHVFEKIGLLDERFFLYYEDVEFCQRARKAGFSISCVPLKFDHAISATTSSLGAANLLYYHSRNGLLLKKLPFWKFWTKLKQRIKILLGKDIEISKAILQGIEDYDKGQFGIRPK